MEMKNQLDESDADLLQLAIVELRTRFDSQRQEIYTQFPVDLG
jgi:excinuclease ABC subunit C